MSDIPPWSHSTLTSFETCARRHYLTKVAREIKEPQTEATIWGNFVHKSLEERVRDDKPLPESIKGYEPIVFKVSNTNGEKLVEHKLALDANFQPTAWQGSWGRGIVDLGILRESSAVMLDWKTGKRKTDSDQLKLMALLAMHTYPQVDKVMTGFVWLKDNKVDKQVFTRQQIGELWQDFLPRVRRLEAAYKQNKWPPKPSGLCKSWCPCTGCEFNGKTR